MCVLYNWMWRNQRFSTWSLSYIMFLKRNKQKRIWNRSCWLTMAVSWNQCLLGITNENENGRRTLGTEWSQRGSTMREGRKNPKISSPFCLCPCPMGERELEFRLKLAPFHIFSFVCLLMRAMALGWFSGTFLSFENKNCTGSQFPK